jgi:hypothetical protein
MSLLLTFFATTICGQKVKESTQDLSKPARKGMLTNAFRKSDGDIVLTYTMKVDKKSDQLAY